MSRPLRLVLSLALLLAAAVTLLSGLTQTTISYLLPAPGGTTTRHTAVYVPAVAASAVAGVTTLATLGWLVLNLIRRPRPAGWLVVGGLVLVDLVVLVVFSGSARPTF